MKSQIFFILLALMIIQPGQSFDGDDFDRPSSTLVKSHGDKGWDGYGQVYAKANGSDIYAGRGRAGDDKTGTGVIVKNGRFDGWAEGGAKNGHGSSTKNQRPTNAPPCGSKPNVNRFPNDQPCSGRPSYVLPDDSFDARNPGIESKGYNDGEVAIESHGDGDWDSYGQGNVKEAKGEEVQIGRGQSGANTGTGIFVRNGFVQGWAEGMAKSSKRSRRSYFDPCTTCVQDHTAIGRMSCLLCNQNKEGKEEKLVIGFDDGQTKIVSHGSKDDKVYSQGKAEAEGSKVALGKAESGQNKAAGVHVENGKADGWGEGMVKSSGRSRRSYYDACTVCERDHTAMGMMSCLLCHQDKEDKTATGFDDGQAKIVSHGGKDNKFYSQGKAVAGGDKVALGKAESGPNKAAGVHVENGKADGWGEGMVNQRRRRHSISKRFIHLDPCTICREGKSLFGISCMLCNQGKSPCPSCDQGRSACPPCDQGKSACPHCDQGKNGKPAVPDKPGVGFDDGKTKTVTHGNKDYKVHSKGKAVAEGDEIAIAEAESGPHKATGVRVKNGKADGIGEVKIN